MNDSEFHDQQRIRNMLRFTWSAFFGKFGALTRVQLLTIPEILSQKNTVIASPTASGKTEAVISPICEILLQTNTKSLGCVYVSPTRALVNDLYERLRGPLNELGLDIGMWTGDHHRFNIRRPQSILLVTPESFDSCLCRFPQLFGNTKFCVYDELHLVDGTYRGDQLRILANRLKAISKAVVFCALSATLKNPEEIASRYFGDASIIKVQGSREILETIITRDEIIHALSDSFARFRAQKISKAIFFCNTRKEAEYVASQMRQIVNPARVVVHHGSLPKSQRESAEQALKEHGFVFCVATTTLEVGIDIGDVDAIVLVRPPPTIFSLLQRIGRGNRRSSSTIVFVLCTSDDEKQQTIEMFRRAKNGELDDPKVEPCLSVAIQQILSMSFQNRNSGILTVDIENLLKPFNLSAPHLALIVKKLVKEDWILEHRGRLYPSTKTLDLAEKGKMHSNINESKGYRVINGLNGEEIGEIGTVDIFSDKIILLGRVWVVKDVVKQRIIVLPSRETIATTRFVRRSNTGAFYGLLPHELQKISTC